MFWGFFNQRGHSIFETILAVSIVGSGLFGGMSVMQNSTLTSQYGDRATVGGELANESMESILADKEFLGYGAVAVENYPSEELAEPFNGFTRTVTVTEVSLTDLTTPQAGSGVKKVEVTVGWGDSDDEKVQLMTLLGDY